ncbi:MAG: DUF4369 domain-containing protein [Mediterranea sp.]|jgi:hypothetical protein|nr:DUF4369 domain-containing protein [Mediterranea sp.]
MKQVPFILCLVILLTACSKKTFTVEGRIDSNSDRDFNTTQIYLLTTTTPAQLIDSTEVQNNTFTFQLPADSVQIALIRPANPIFQYFLQPLLVATESGTVQVVLGKNSTGQGTPLNQALQNWKQHKANFNSHLQEIYRDYWKASSEEKDRIDSLKRALSEADETFQLRLIEENKDNAFGEFLKKLQ